MQTPIRSLVRILFRFGVVWAVDAVSLMLAAWLLPGISLTPLNGSSVWVTATAAAFMLGIVNLLVRPLILLLVLPLGFFVIFAIGFIVNAVTLLITAALMPTLQVNGFIAAFLGGLLIAAINTVVLSFVSLDDDDSFFQGLVERLAQRQPSKGATEQSRGLVMLEIDGLSYYHMKQALEAGRLPHAKRLMEEQGYELSHVDCGLPSQTSACQAGIMFGDNYDIPAFRWYDKDQGRAFVSGKDAAEINARYAKGNGLMRGGSSINNMMNGDAAKSLLTLADLRSGSPEEKKQRARDIYLLMINPYFIMRTVVLLLGEAITEVWQYYSDKRHNVQPLLNRTHHFYPFVRGATTVFMRDVAEYLVTLDIIRGAPSIYATWPGYDEVAHHTGPSTDAALAVLAKYDKTIGRVADVIRRKAPRPYDLIILSDHGQSFGATYSQRYGHSLKEFIERHLPAGTGVQQSIGGDDGTIGLAAVSGELQNMAEQGVAGGVGTSVARSGQRALEGPADAQDGAPQAGDGTAPPAVTVFGSGNLAPVYFHFSDKRVTRPELDATYPGLFPALLENEGVGAILGYESGGTPVVWGKSGIHNLHTGEVEGADPLTMYGDPALRAKQLCRLAEFPHNGDLTVFSPVYTDGTVAAMEELIGSHGGMGGVQTDAFLFHPADMQVPTNTTNSTDVFHILNARRGQPVVPKPAGPHASQIDDWAPGRLAQGISQVGQWLPLAGRAALLRTEAFAEVVRRPLMTGPALLIGVLAPIIGVLGQITGFDITLLLERLLTWLVITVVVFGTGRLLQALSTSTKAGRRTSYTELFRGLGFAQGAHVLGLLALIPVFGNFARLLTTILPFIASWVAAVVAHELRGWRAIVFPLVMLVVYVLSVLVIVGLLRGAALSLATLAQQLGFAR
jgi:uncharacterized membrane protein YvlD (DUF360 family)